MTFELACKKAMEILADRYEFTELESAFNVGDKWLFYGTNKEHRVFYGSHGITINKGDGEVNLFCLPDEKNLKILEEAVEIEIPKEYKP